MQRLILNLAIAVSALAIVPAVANCQVIVQPQPGPFASGPMPLPPAPGMAYTVPPPPVLRPTAYSFNGPAPATVGYVVRTTTYYSAPGSTRLMPATHYTPVLGYQPGYYSNYYTPLFFRY